MLNKHGHTYDFQPRRPWAQCSRCGFDVRLDTMRREWSGGTYCPECWDPLPDTMRPPSTGPEGLPRPNAQPALPDAFIQTRITPDDL